MFDDNAHQAIISSLFWTASCRIRRIFSQSLRPRPHGHSESDIFSWAKESDSSWKCCGARSEWLRPLSFSPLGGDTTWEGDGHLSNRLWWRPTLEPIPHRMECLQSLDPFPSQALLRLSTLLNKIRSKPLKCVTKMSFKKLVLYLASIWWDNSLLLSYTFV